MMGAGKSGQGRAGQGRAGQGRAGQGRAGQGTCVAAPFKRLSMVLTTTSRWSS